jgi:hypothetical protein
MIPQQFVDEGGAPQHRIRHQFLAAANHDLIVRARNRGFEAIHINLPPLNLKELLLS